MHLAEIIAAANQPDQACFGQLGAPSGLVGLARLNWVGMGGIHKQRLEDQNDVKKQERVNL